MNSSEPKKFQPIINKKARFDFEILDTIEAGLVLTGPEVKSIRIGKVQLQESHIRILGDQAWVINMTIQAYPHARQEDYDPKQSRRLLLHRKEIYKLIGLTDQKHIALIPLKLYQTHNRFKLAIGIAKGKKEFQKKEAKKKEDIKRDTLFHLKEATRYHG